MKSLEEMEREATDFGGTRTFTVGDSLVQVIAVRDGLSRNMALEYRLNGWPVHRLQVVRVLAGNEPEPRETYQEMLENRVGGGLKISGVSRA
jgi:hypothetical protein